jgi:GNAT superfamily N-acetyltransferase
MSSEQIQYNDSRRDVPLDTLINLYRANHWSSAEKPELLRKALASSHSLVTAGDGERLVGLGNALSDGFMVVYYSHMLVLPDYQGRGIGMQLMQLLLARYQGFHQHVLIADARAIDFYWKS